MTEFENAERLFRELGSPFYLAATQLEHGEWLIEQGRSDDAQPLQAEALRTFEQLRATPWIERAARATPAEREHETAIS